MPGIEDLFVRVRGSRLTLGTSDYPVAGTNCYYLGYCPKDPPEMVKSVLDTAQAMALNVVRLWAFLEPANPPGDHDGVPWGAYFQYAEGGAIRPNESDDGLGRLDRAVWLAGQRGIRLILVLSNSLPDFGGMDQYLQWLSQEGKALFHDDFYEREDVCQAFEAWIRYLILRPNPLTGRLYRDEPAILAWELANEPRCYSGGLPARGDCASSARLLTWAQRMSVVIKQTDPNHLVGVGDEGFFRRPFSGSFLHDGKTGVDTARLLDIHAVDFGTFHLYPQGWGQDRGFGRKRIEEHLKLGRSAGKPMLLEEFGVSLDGDFVSGPADRNALYAEWLDAVADQDGAGSLFWMVGGADVNGGRFHGTDPFCLFDSADAPAIEANARRLTGSAGPTGSGISV